MAARRIRVTVNGVAHAYTGDGEQPLLWMLRDELGLTATKYGCGIGACGACTVQVDGQAVRSCAQPMAGLDGRQVMTAEGLVQGDALHPVQQAWIEHHVPQCGYCQAGQMMSAAALLRRVPRPTDAQIDDAMRGNLCRCGTYARIRAAVHRAAALMAGRGRSA